MSKKVSRRQAIRMLALGGLALGLGLEELRSLTSGSTPRLTRIHQTRLLMGTPATLTVLTDQPTAARAAVEAAFTRMSRLEQVLSRYQPSSQVSQLNRTGAITAPALELAQLVAKAMAYGERTGGAFDVTVEPVLALYRRAAQQGRLPEAAEIRAHKPLVDYRQIRQQPGAISLRQPGMAITLDGLAKGYVLDAGADVFLRHGFGDVLVEAGGDMMARGRSGSGGWQIGIQSPRSASAVALLGTIEVENVALATSGDYRHTFSGTTHHHILNPETGDSPTTLSSVTVLAPNACDADALSTALMVLGPREGLKAIGALSNTHALIIDKEGRLQRSASFPDWMSPVNPTIAASQGF